MISHLIAGPQREEEDTIRFHRRHGLQLGFYLGLVTARGKLVDRSWILLLLSLDAHNHVDDYSGTLGSVRKVHISALVTSPKN